MSQQTVVDLGVAFNIPIAITKSGVNVERRTVRGIMTQEVVDSHGEEVDFESVKKCLASWRGNIREMHQPKAVGKAVDIIVLDDIKAVEVESYISKGAEDTWQKCLDGTLGFYSIGGVGDRVMGLRSDGSTGPRLIMRKLGELSVVDSGSCPTSSISVVKLVDGEPVEQLSVDVERGERGDEPHGGDKSTPYPAATEPSNMTDVTLTLAHGVLKGLGFKSQRWNITNALSALAMLEDLITEQCYETLYNGEGAPDNAAQVDLLKLAAQIVIDFIATEFEQQFESGDELMKLDAEQQTIVKSVIEKAGARHSRRDVEMLQGMHDNTVKLGAACGVEKMDKTEATAPTTATVEPTPATTADPAVAADATVVKAETPDATETPAATPTETSSTTEVVKAETVIPASNLAETIANAVSKAVDAAAKTFTTQIEELKATSATTIATLQDRVEKLSNEPQPGGPVANAHAQVIEKGGAQLDELLNNKETAIRVIAALEDVAKSETDPTARERIVEQALSLRMQHSIGAVHIPIPSAR